MHMLIRALLLLAIEFTLVGSSVQPLKQTIELLFTLKQTKKDSSVTRSGFRNLGNQCYRNAILQVLLRLPGMNYCAERPASIPGRKMKMLEALCEVQQRLDRKAVLDAGKVNDAVVASTDIVDGVEQFGSSAQQDPDELFRKISDIVGYETTKSPFRDFDLVVKNVAKCEMCSGTRETGNGREEVEMLTLALPEVGEGQAVSLHTMLNSHLVDERQLYCEKCAQNENHHVRKQITQVPKYLYIQISRFARWRTARKVRTTVILPRTLSIAGKMSTEFLLHGFVEHHGGSVNSGHYTATVLVDGSWLHFDDTVVKLRSLGPEIQSKDVYLVIYARQDIVRSSEGIKN